MFDSHDKEWKAFYLKEIFTTVSNTGTQVPTGAYVHRRYLHKGKQPRITVTALNNGIGAFYDEIKNQNKREFSNFISISFLGDAFYHRYSATLDMKVHCLKLKDRELSLYLGEFLITALDMNKSNSNYGNQLSSKDVARKQVILPVQKNGDPDYDYMEQYMKKWYEKKVWDYSFYCAEQLRKLGKKKPLPTLSEKEWKEYYISDIFLISSGKRLTKADMITGERPFIGATDNNNGVTCFVSNTNKSLDKNVLGVNYNGSVVENFYHPYECVFSDDVKRFHLKEVDDDKYIYLFLKTMLLKQKDKFKYGYKFKEARMKKQKIMLPINDDGNPDYDYMKQYMKNLMIMKYSSWQSYVSTGFKNF